LFLAFFFLQTGVFSAETKENSKSSDSAKQDAGKKKQETNIVKPADVADKKPKAEKADVADKESKAEKTDNDDDEADALKSWRNQASPGTKNWDRTNTSQAGKSLKSTYKVHTDKDMRSAAFRLND